MATGAGQDTRVGRYRWAICALLFFVITINYIDRQVLGVLKPVIEKDLGWSEVDYGNIVSAFQFSYGIGLLVVGKVLDRIGTRWGMAIAIAVWSLAAMFHAAARSVLVAPRAVPDHHRPALQGLQAGVDVGTRTVRQVVIAAQAPHRVRR